jgi:taurine dioxygenase
MNPIYTTSIVGISQTESDNYLKEIFEFTLQKKHILRYKWNKNDLVIYDNRSLIHTATPIDENARRVIYRLGIMEQASDNKNI